MKTIDVICPFTGAANLPLPVGNSWAGQIPNTNIWYFSGEEVICDGINQCIADLLGNTTMSEAEQVVAILMKKDYLRQVGDWWFVKLPIGPAMRLPTATDIILAKSVESTCNDLEDRFREYLNELRIALSTY